MEFTELTALLDDALLDPEVATLTYHQYYCATIEDDDAECDCRSFVIPTSDIRRKGTEAVANLIESLMEEPEVFDGDS